MVIRSILNLPFAVQRNFRLPDGVREAVLFQLECLEKKHRGYGKIYEKGSLITIEWKA